MQRNVVLIIIHTQKLIYSVNHVSLNPNYAFAAATACQLQAQIPQSVYIVIVIGLCLSFEHHKITDD